MSTPLKTGEILRERYTIRRIIGQGGMGSIYLADDLRLEGRLCALKEVEHDSSLPKDMLEGGEGLLEEFLPLGIAVHAVEPAHDPVDQRLRDIGELVKDPLHDRRRGLELELRSLG